MSSRGKNFIDLTDKRFGRLVVINRAEDYISPKGKHFVCWLCKCDCGNEVVVNGNSLRRKATQSCGCLQKEIVAKQSKKYNTYDLSGDYGIGYTSNGEKFYFDLEDYDKIKDYCWCVAERHNYKTLEAKRLDGSNKNIKMSHLLGFENYDHIDRNPLNNRKENLRAATTAENSRNRNISKNNTSGIIGVGLNKKNGKWRARITFEWNEIFLGEYIKKEDAIITRLKAEKKYFGEFAPQQYLYKEYNIE